jgi:ribonuclease BN (tRNA processing enzyme)
LVVRGSLYLVDAGDNVARRIQESGHDFRAVDKVFLTHLHGDHTWGLAHLVGSAWQYHRKRPIDVYGSGVEPLVRGLIAYLTPNAEIWALTGKAPLTDVVRAHEIQPGVIYRDANVTVTAVENTHFHFKRESPAYGKYRSYSYRFDTPTRAIVFTGDTSTSDALTELARGADVLVTEVADPDAVVALLKQTGGWAKRTPAEQEGLVRHLTESHLSAVEVGRLAAKAGVGRVVMTHLVPTVDPADRYERYVTEARRHYAGPIAIAEDLMRF